MYVQLEDEFGDIIGKARRGQELEVADLAKRVGLPAADIGKIEEYEMTPDSSKIAKLANNCNPSVKALKTAIVLAIS